MSNSIEAPHIYSDLHLLLSAIATTYHARLPHIHDMAVNKQMRATIQELAPQLRHKHLRARLRPFQDARAIRKANGLNRVEHLHLQEATLLLEPRIPQPGANGDAEDLIGHSLEASVNDARAQLARDIQGAY